MSGYIKVMNLQGIEDYGESLKQYSDEYEKAVQSCHQTLVQKGETSQGEAVAAYLDKLNELQTQVYSQYPAALRDYGKVFSTYHSALSGLGFQRKAWSSVDGANEVSAKLTGDQSTTVTDVKNSIKSVLDDAADFLKIDRPSLDTPTNRTLDDLTTAASNRTRMATRMDEAFTTFKSDLATYQGQISALVASLQNAQHIGSLDVKTVKDLIKDGKLTASNMGLLNTLQDSGDGDALNLLLTAPDKFNALGKLDPTHISPAMMDVIYNKIYTAMNMEPVDIVAITAFVNGLATLDADKAKIYLEKLIYASDRFATVLGAGALGMLPEFPPPGSPEEVYAAYDARMRELTPVLQGIDSQMSKAGKLTALFEGLYVVGIGRNIEKQPDFRSPRGSAMVLSNVTISGLTLTEDGFSFTYTKAGSNGEPVETHFSTNYDDIKGHGDLQQLSALNEKRSQAILGTLQSLAFVAANYYMPGSGAVLSFAEDALNACQSRTASAGLDSADSAGKLVFGDQFSKGASSALKAGSDIFGLFEQLDSINRQIDEIKKGLGYQLFDVGGYAVSGHTGSGSVKFDVRYDLGALMQINDMNQHGLRPYIYHSDGGGASGVDAFDVSGFGFNRPSEIPRKKDPDSDASYLTQDVQDLLTGKGDLTVSDIPIEDLRKGLIYVSRRGNTSVPIKYSSTGSNHYDQYRGESTVE